MPEFFIERGREFYHGQRDTCQINSSVYASITYATYVYDIITHKTYKKNMVPEAMKHLDHCLHPFVLRQ